MKSKNVVQQTDTELDAVKADLHKAKAAVRELFKNDMDKATAALMAGSVYHGMMLGRLAATLDAALKLSQQGKDSTDEQRGA